MLTFILVTGEEIILIENIVSALSQISRFFLGLGLIAFGVLVVVIVLLVSKQKAKKDLTEDNEKTTIDGVK